MTDIAEDLKELLPHLSAEHDKDEEFLWVYEPPTEQGQEGKIHLANARTDHPADFPTHEDVAPEVTHPDRMEGYAYSIQGGWRITDAEHHKVEDPYLKRLILSALRGESPPPPLPHIRQHGDPLRGQ